MKRTLRWAADRLGISMKTDAQVTGWNIDTRTITPGDLFFALRGPNHDGNAYIDLALEKGAVGVVSDARLKDGSNVLNVDDSLIALQTLANQARHEWGGQVVGVTGSAGKTTTKDIVAELLSEEFHVEKTQGNLNNHIGLPLSLLRLDENAQLAVLELGMNHAGEIQTLAEIARPNVGVVTNVGWAHIESFDSVEGIAAAKRELIEALGFEGVAILNADDDRVSEFAKAHQGRSVLYGQSVRADIRAEDVEYSLDGANFRVGNVRFETQLTGRHSVSNILAGLATASVFGIAPDRLTARVRDLKPAKMRGERLTHNGILIYNDCYNSNPDAVSAMLDVLRDTTARRRIAVLGEMLELGAWSERLHSDIGAYAAAHGIDMLVGIRGASASMVAEAKRRGLETLFFEQPTSAGQFVRSIAEPGDAILFKGSRGIHVEDALNAFLGTPGGGSH